MDSGLRGAQVGRKPTAALSRWPYFTPPAEILRREAGVGARVAIYVRAVWARMGRRFLPAERLCRRCVRKRWRT